MHVDLIASCPLCGKSVSQQTDCWRASVAKPSLVHVLCLAAFMLMGESPAHLNHEIVDDINGAAADICAEWCENPAHTASPLERN